VNERSFLRINATCSDLASIRQFVEDEARRAHSRSDAIQDMVIATNEAVTNVLTHGYQGQPGMIEIEVSFENKKLMVRLRDQAPMFDPTADPSDQFAPSLDQPLSGGMGIHMMRELTDEIIYRKTTDGRNELILIIEGVRNQRFEP
jgi:serine/threonine-protein kinase RsbW